MTKPISDSATWLWTNTNTALDQLGLGILDATDNLAFLQNLNFQNVYTRFGLLQLGFDFSLGELGKGLQGDMKELATEILEGLAPIYEDTAKAVGGYAWGQFEDTLDDIDRFIRSLPLRELLSKGQALGREILDPLLTLTNELIFTVFPKTPTKPADATDIVTQAMTTIMGATLSIGGAVALGELVHPVKEAGFKYVSSLLFDMAGFGSMGSAITMSFAEYAFIQPLRHALAALYQPSIPGQQDLIQFLVREQLTPQEFNETMLFHGFNQYWADKYWDAHWQLPGISLSREMLYRGQISFEEYVKLLELNDFHPDYRQQLANIAYRLPGVNDIIRFAVREVFSREATLGPGFAGDLPPGFRENMALLGYDPQWANRFWDAHWELIPVNRLFEAFYRHKIDLPRLTADLVRHDFRPEDIEIILGTTYRQIPIIYLRRAWELGELSDEDLIYQLEIHGYDPAITPQLARIVKRMALENEISEVRREWIKDFDRGWINRDTLEQQITFLGYKADVVAFYVRKAELSRARRLRDNDLKILVQLYRKGVFTDTDFKTKLLELQLQPEFVEDLLRLEKVKRDRELEEVILEW